MTNTFHEIDQWLTRQTKLTGQPAWQLKPVERAEFELVKALFVKLHDYNASLDPYFTLSWEWESHFDVYMEHALECQRCLCLVARNVEDGRPAGFILATVQQESAMWQHRDWVEIAALYIEPQWRGQNLAEKLLEPVYHWVEFLGLSRVQLYVTATNERALNFYTKSGFNQIQAILRKVV